MGGEAWRFRVRWAPIGERETQQLAGTWLVAVPARRAEQESIADVMSALAAGGARPLVVEVDGDTTDREQLAESLRALLVAESAANGNGAASAACEERVEVAGVLSLLALEEAGPSTLEEAGPPTLEEAGPPTLEEAGPPTLEEAGPPTLGGVGAGVAGTLALMQALGDAEVAAPLWCVTRGAVSVGPAGSPHRPGGGAGVGVGRVLALEEPERWGGLVDLPRPSATSGRLPACCDALGATGGRGRTGSARRRPVQAAAGARGQGSRREQAYRPRGTVLVTGGTGALGAHVARWLAENGAERIVLASRGGSEAPGAGELVAELEALGASTTVAPCDVADRAQLRELLDEIPAEQPLSAVFHLAGSLDDGLLEGLTRERLGGAMRAKADAAWLLHELTEELELDAFVLFSSIAGTLGSGGQGAYAAGNAFLDALAELRRGRGLPAIAIAWGPWAGEGMAADVGELLSTTGTRAMVPELALESLRWALDRGEHHLVVADVDWERALADGGWGPRADAASGRPRAVLRDLPDVNRILTSRPPVGAAATIGGLAARLREVPAGQRERVVLELVREQAAAVLGHTTVAAVEAGRAFKKLGFDSLAGVQLRNRLAAATGLRLASSLVFDHPTPAALARHLLGEATGAPVGVRAVSVVGPVDEPIAIVGMGADTRVSTSPAAPPPRAHRSSCGSSSPPAPRGSAASRPTAAGTWSGCTTPTTRARAPAPRMKAGSCTTRASSTRPSSGSARARRWRWIRSSGCCWRCAGRRWRMPGSTPSRCAAARAACSPGSACATTRRPCRVGRRASWRVISAPAARAAWCPAASPTPSVWRARR